MSRFIKFKTSSDAQLELGRQPDKKCGQCGAPLNSRAVHTFDVVAPQDGRRLRMEFRCCTCLDHAESGCSLHHDAWWLKRRWHYPFRQTLAAADAAHAREVKLLDVAFQVGGAAAAIWLWSCFVVECRPPSDAPTSVLAELVLTSPLFFVGMLLYTLVAERTRSRKREQAADLDRSGGQHGTRRRDEERLHARERAFGTSMAYAGGVVALLWFWESACSEMAVSRHHSIWLDLAISGPLIFGGMMLQSAQRHFRSGLRERQKRDARLPRYSRSVRCSGCHSVFEEFPFDPVHGDHHPYHWQPDNDRGGWRCCRCLGHAPYSCTLDERTAYDPDAKHTAG